MKRILLLGTLLLLTLTGCGNNLATKENQTEQKSESSIQYQKISASDANTMIENNDYDIILDVRTLDEFNQGHIKGALLIPDYDLENEAEIELPNKDDIILIYCRSGNRSASAAKQLIKMGYTKVYDFGGIKDWPYEVAK